MGLSRQEHEDLYYWLLLTRRAEEHMRCVYRDQKAGKIEPVFSGNLYLSTYQEAVSVGAAFACRDSDWISHTHRDLGALLVKGRWDLNDVFANVLGRAESPAQGHDSGLNIGSKEKATLTKHIFMCINPVIACGVAGVCAEKKEGNVILAFLGDGATSQGYFHETLNGAGLGKLPIIFIVNNNQYAISTPVEGQVAGGFIYKKAENYGFPGVWVDGKNILEVYHVVHDAISRTRAGGGPTLIEAETFRLCGHAEHDVDNQTGIPSYMTQEQWEAEKTVENDPLWRYRQHLLVQGVMKEEDFAAHEEDVAATIKDAWEKALALPPPEPGGDQLFAEDQR
ncbi:hypothetical protein A2797_01135 [candidate division WWE3 bacterium RIFCSPHIGHO2_01_FULL_48_15]|uniref:Dehydrogenase E1 component domain-containing protein n=1 Tax=candidate division WWE3 bacterium RIFCSPHIGHO2_01_FULL_48_15 TaxID=1802619 RepID=A0A1F4VG16_UNCKA|nr:MAG: hypothetical protein A2797_01135 [candidate division WWE3 bacterium RIFCSPHIGHO2_01_FULL_48_15]